MDIKDVDVKDLRARFPLIWARDQVKKAEAVKAKLAQETEKNISIPQNSTVKKE